MQGISIWKLSGNIYSKETCVYVKFRCIHCIRCIEVLNFKFEKLAINLLRSKYRHKSVGYFCLLLKFECVKFLFIWTIEIDVFRINIPGIDRTISTDIEEIW